MNRLSCESQGFPERAPDSIPSDDPAERRNMQINLTVDSKRKSNSKVTHDSMSLDVDLLTTKPKHDVSIQ